MSAQRLTRTPTEFAPKSAEPLCAAWQPPGPPYDTETDPEMVPALAVLTIADAVHNNRRIVVTIDLLRVFI